MTKEPDATPQTEAVNPAEPPPRAAAGSGRRRSPEFRQELLGRLPRLPAPQWQASETLNVYQELQGIVDLDADAFLKPLEKIAEERHE